MPSLPTRRRLLTTLVTLPFWPLASAQAQVGRRYRIELILFEHLSLDSRLAQEQARQTREANLSGHAIGEGPLRPASRGFQLHAVTDRIRATGAGRILAELAWEQIGRDFHSTPWVRIQAGASLGLRQEATPDFFLTETTATDPGMLRHELEGRLRVWVGRFLHLETDLIFHVAHTPGSDPDQLKAIAVRGSQRMASGNDLFYLDHPVIGGIARVTRL